MILRAVIDVGIEHLLVIATSKGFAVLYKGVSPVSSNLLEHMHEITLRNILPSPELSIYRALYEGLLRQLNSPHSPLPLQQPPAFTSLLPIPSCATPQSSPTTAATLSLPTASSPAHQHTKTGLSAKILRRRRYLRRRDVRNAQFEKKLRD